PLDLARRLLVIDVDQKDPGPGVDGRLIVAAVEGVLALVEQRRDAAGGLVGAAAAAVVGGRGGGRRLGERRGVEGRRREVGRATRQAGLVRARQREGVEVEFRQGHQVVARRRRRVG